MLRIKMTSVVYLVVMSLGSSAVFASEVQQWSVQIVDDVAVLRANKSTDTEFIQGTISALKESGMKKFTLLAQETIDNVEEGNTALSIRIVDGDAEISASNDLPYKVLVATITQLKDAGVKIIKFNKIENSTSESAAPTDEKELAADLELLQGAWELYHGKQKDGKPNSTRSVKIVEANKETLRRYNTKTGELTHEHSVEFTLSKSGDVRVFTFYRVGGSPERGSSFVYKIDKDNFYDVTGLLQGDKYRNYQSKINIWHWKRVADIDLEEPTKNSATKSDN